MAKPAPIDGLDADTPLTEAAQQSIAARLGDVRQYEKQERSDTPDPDEVHDMREATRMSCASTRSRSAAIPPIPTRCTTCAWPRGGCGRRSSSSITSGS